MILALLPSVFAAIKSASTRIKSDAAAPNAAPMDGVDKGFFCPLYLLLLRFMSIFPPNPITQEAQHTAQGIEYHVIHITTAHAAEQLDHFYRDGKLHGKKCCRPEIDRSSADTGQEKSKRGKAYDIAQQVQKYPPGSNRLVILDVTHDLPKRDQIVAILIHCIFPKCLCKKQKIYQ